MIIDVFSFVPKCFKRAIRHGSMANLSIKADRIRKTLHNSCIAALACRAGNMREYYQRVRVFQAWRPRPFQQVQLDDGSFATTAAQCRAARLKHTFTKFACPIVPMMRLAKDMWSKSSPPAFLTYAQIILTSWLICDCQSNTTGPPAWMLCL